MIGLKTFSEFFRDFTDSYIVIGGAACEAADTSIPREYFNMVRSVSGCRMKYKQKPPLSSPGLIVYRVFIPWSGNDT
jgi:hypothetical protein